MVKILKGKADWRRVDIGSGILTGDDATGCLAGIEELTDYDLVADNHGSWSVSEESRKRRVTGGGGPRNKNKKKNAQKKKSVFIVESQTPFGGGSEDIRVEDEDNGEESDVQPEDLLPWENIFVPKEVARALVEKGFSHPTEIQRLCIPAAIKGRRDLLGAAETGSGKTLAFGIPIIFGIMKNLQSLEKDRGALQESDCTGDEGSEFESDHESDGGGRGCVKVTNLGFAKGGRRGADRLWALVLAPTRELAIQVKDHIEAAAKYTPVKVAVVVGGMSVEKQSRILTKKRPHIVVATPGRLWELITTGEPHLADAHLVRYLAIDETDRMLEKDHFPELRQLLERINYADQTKGKAESDGGAVKKQRKGSSESSRRQNFVFSATLTFVHDPPDHLKKKGRHVKKLSSEQKLKDIMTLLGIADPKIVDVTKKTGTAAKLTESCIFCPADQKDTYLHYFLERHPGRTLVFCNSVASVRRLTSLLNLLGAKPLPIHANMHQRQRLNNLDRFRSNPRGVLLATDVAARGLDIPDVQHVIHYQVPTTSEGYIHRSGRTARAESEGLTLMLVEPAEVRYYTKICSTLDRAEDLPEFPVDSGGVSRARERVRYAREVDLLEMSVRKTSSSVAWMEKAANDMDMILDDDQLPSRPDAEAAGKLRQLCRTKRRRLAALMAVPLFQTAALIADDACAVEPPSAVEAVKTAVGERDRKRKGMKLESLPGMKIFRKKKSLVRILHEQLDTT